jgi:hypothetical protein
VILAFLGLEYWKCNSRKFFAVSPLHGKKRSRARGSFIGSETDTDDDFQLSTFPKRSRELQSIKELLEATSSSLGDQVKNVGDKIASLEVAVDMQADDSALCAKIRHRGLQ